MHHFKKLILYVVLLVALCICSTIVMELLDLILKLNYENIWSMRFKIGFTVWIGMIINEGYHWVKDKINKR